MHVIVRILLGAFTGWLTGKAVGEEGYGRVSRPAHVTLLDAIYGIVGAFLGDHLFFWIVIGQGSPLSNYATTILGSITFVGAARLLAGRLASYRTRQYVSRR
jgi:uncharacterized membrane protein YeaQ/YmgE (transglycosylase-associated protein family)